MTKQEKKALNSIRNLSYLASIAKKEKRILIVAGCFLVLLSLLVFSTTNKFNWLVILIILLSVIFVLIWRKISSIAYQFSLIYACREVEEQNNETVKTNFIKTCLDEINNNKILNLHQKKILIDSIRIAFSQLPGKVNRRKKK